MVKPSRARSRDYKAEEARRNAKARELGFTSRAHMRRALKQGWKPVRKSAKPRSPIDYVSTKTTAKPAPPSGALSRLRRESADWSRKHSRMETSQYDPSFTPTQVRRYHAAYVNPSTKASRIENGFDALRDWLISTMSYYTDEEFLERYGHDAFHF